MTAFKRGQAKYVKHSYKTTNWPEYDPGLRDRGSLAVWISEEELKEWTPSQRKQRKPGSQERYSSHAIATALAVGLAGEVIASNLTSKSARDTSRVPALPKEIDRPPASLCADSAHDNEGVYETAANHTETRSPRVLIPPRKNTQVRPEVAALKERNRNIRSRARLGKRQWHTKSACSRTSLVENTIYPYKAIIGPSMMSRTLQRQRVEARVGCRLLNTMAALGMPESHRVA